MRFEWDADKASTNFAKHGVSFGEAVEVFYDLYALEGYDDAHSLSDSRFFNYWSFEPTIIVCDLR